MRCPESQSPDIPIAESKRKRCHRRWAELQLPMARQLRHRQSLPVECELQEKWLAAPQAERIHRDSDLAQVVDCRADRASRQIRFDGGRTRLCRRGLYPKPGFGIGSDAQPELESWLVCRAVVQLNTQKHVPSIAAIQ